MTEGPLLAFLRLLADGAGDDALAVALTEGLLREVRPNQVSAYLVDRDGTCLEERLRYAATNAPPAPGQGAVPLEVPLPATEVFRTGRAGMWTLTEAAASFPALAGWVRDQPERAADRVFLEPIRVLGRPVGVLIVSIPGPEELSGQVRRLMDTAATALAVWAMAHASFGARRRARGDTLRIEVSDRQARIVDAASQGLSNAEIAQKLGVSVATVKGDLARLYRLFGVSDRTAMAELVAEARGAKEPSR